MKPLEQRQALRALITSDATLTDLEHTAILAKLRELTEQIDDNSVRPMWELLGAADDDELTTAIIDDGHFRTLQLIFTLQEFSATERTLRRLWRNVFGQGSKSMTALNQLGRRAGSKLDVAGVPDAGVSDVADAILRTPDV